LGYLDDGSNDYRDEKIKRRSGCAREVDVTYTMDYEETK
jgi:hypothetical protein